MADPNPVTQILFDIRTQRIIVSGTQIAGSSDVAIMNICRAILAGWMAFQLGFSFTQAQPILNPQSPFQTPAGTGIANLRVTQQSADGTEAILTMDYSYDGIAGRSAVAIPLIEKRDQKGVSAWFGADPVAIGIGKGVFSIKVKYFNDEPGVPPELTTDRLRILILNQSESAVLSSIPFLKTIKWGKPGSPPAPLTLTQAPAQPQETSPSTAPRPKTAAVLKAEREAEQKAKTESAAREAARLKAEKDAKKLADAKERRDAELKAREDARLKAEAAAERLSEEKRLAEQKAKAEEKSRAEARERAQAEAKARREAEAKAKADAAAREEAQKTAEAEAKRLAREKKLTEEKAKKEAQAKEKTRLMAEAKAREQERLKAEAEAKRLADEKRVAEKKARSEAAAREQARLRAEAEEKSRVEAEEKSKKEAAARETARRKAEAETKRLVEEKRLAEIKAKADEEASEAARLKAETEAKRLAEEQRQADQKAKAEAETRLSAVEKSRPPVPVQTNVLVIPTSPSTRTARRILALDPIATDLKTKITNVDVVNRSLDRTRMTIGVEYDYKDSLGPKPMLGVDVTKMDEPDASQYFESQPAEIAKSRRNFVLFPIKFQPPGNLGGVNSFTTDRVLVYLAEATSSKRFNLFPTTMLLLWRPPGVAAMVAAKVESGSTLELDDFKQTEPSAGYVTVKYNLVSGPGKLRMRIFDSAKAPSAEWFSTGVKNVPAGRGLQVLDVSVNPNAKAPTQIFSADNIEIELVDSTGKVAARISKQLPMTWAKPE